MKSLLSQTEIKTALALAPGWTRRGKTITRLYILPDFVQALAFVNYVGYLAEKADHHPDIDIRYKRVSLTLSTHSEGGLTAKDFNLARQIDR